MATASFTTKLIEREKARKAIAVAVKSRSRKTTRFDFVELNNSADTHGKVVSLKATGSSARKHSAVYLRLLKQMSSDDFMHAAVKAGVLTSSGKLSSKYR